MNCISPVEVWPSNKKMIVPCGKCLACLENKRNDWSFRLLQEFKRSKGAAFVTLTYHNGTLPVDGLNKRHVQLFFKRLRKNARGKNIRYYLVGEYGSKTGRAHYHALLFNSEGLEPAIRKAWTYKGKEIGIVHIGKVTEASIRYCTKYVIQRVDWKYEPQRFVIPLNKPFALMSRAYGIGAHYLSDQMVLWHRSGLKNYAILYGKKVRLPRFYKDKIWWRYRDKNMMDVYEHPDRNRVNDESKWKGIKERRKNIRELKAMGYEPSKIIAEMRNAVLSRVKQKVAYTQIY